MKSLLKSGSEPFLYHGKKLPFNVLGFWSWGFSDLLSNSLRGILAEYIVAQAIGVTHEPRIEWNLYDLVTTQGTTVEVKSAAYIQAWIQNKPSRICFSIRSAAGWDSTTNTTLDKPSRSAQVYVFCVLKHMDRETIDALNLDQWDFYLLATSTLDIHCVSQQTITLTRLLQLGALRVDYQDLADAIERVAQNV